MKNIQLCIIALLFFEILSCSSGISTGNADLSVTDIEQIADTDENYDDQKLNDEILNDNDSDNAENDVESDDDMASICDPNPCETVENIAAHKIRCVPENEGSFYVCKCNQDYSLSGGLCCQPFSSNVEGKCKCITYYVAPSYSPGQCVPVCTKDTIEGLNGYCGETGICQNGQCITNLLCLGYECPEDSFCYVEKEFPFCQCNTGLHKSNGKCCPYNSTNKSGVCVCDEGYEPDGAKCKETACSKINPDGTCEDANAACVDGECVSSIFSMRIGKERSDQQFNIKRIFRRYSLFQDKFRT